MAGGGSAHGTAEPSNQRLATQLARTVRFVVAADPLTAESLDAAAVLTDQAVRLAPEDPDLWRTALRLATLSERDERRRQAVRQLVSVDPWDEPARLLRIDDAVAGYHTAEDRIDFYLKLLSPENRELVGAPVASRLAMDLAMLHRARGNLDGFSEWLAQAVSLDPANRPAVATAAGFFQWNVDDPYAHAELLVSLLLADPADTATQVTLAELLLEHGAYVGASRLYDMATRYRQAAGVAVTAELRADQAIAQWGQGRAEDALRTIRDHQRELDIAHRSKSKQQQPQLRPLELAGMHAPPDPTLAMVQAGVLTRRGADEAASAGRDAVAAYQAALDAANADATTEPAVLARLYVEMAAVAIWRGAEDLDRVSGWLQSAEAIQPLSDEAGARFEGWIALRRGEPARAIEILQPWAETDAAARLGVALALRDLGQVSDATAELRAVARAVPGKLVGVWAADQLVALGAEPLDPTPLAARLEQLIETIPTAFDRYPESPTLAVAIRVAPAKPTFEPYEPVLVNLTITNNTSVPLAIDPDGPIRPQVALLMRARITKSPRLDQLSPIIVDIDRRLRLRPRETLTVTVDLRRTPLGEVLNTYPLSGAMVRVKAVLNVTSTPYGVIRPSLLGSEHETAPFRVDGVRVNASWIEQALASVVEADAREHVELLALLSHVLVIDDLPETSPLRADAAAALVSAYPELDPVSQAWLLGVMAPSEAIEPILEMARTSEQKLVRIAYLTYRPESPTDPVLEAARHSDDADMRAIAEAIGPVLERRAALNQ
ncbi:MAG: hypothetical protein ACYSTY_04970 [Planctomycetota bacterium]